MQGWDVFVYSRRILISSPLLAVIENISRILPQFANINPPNMRKFIEQPLLNKGGILLPEPVARRVWPPFTWLSGCEGCEPNARWNHYVAFGLRISAQLSLPELGSPAPAGPVADVKIHFESLPAELPSGTASNNEFVLDAGKIARYRIRGGTEIAIDPHIGSSERNIRLYLLGSAMGILCHQRGLMPLHANAIAINGSAVAFAGRKGVGKSTLAAHFQARGFKVLCDDVCVVGFDKSGGPVAWPGLPRLKLWRDAAQAFGHNSNALERVADGIEKYLVPLSAPAVQTPFPLARIYILGDLAPGSPAAISRLTGTAAPQAILLNIYRPEFLAPMGLAAANFTQVALVAKDTQVFTAPRERGYHVFSREAARLESHVREGKYA